MLVTLKGWIRGVFDGKELLWSQNYLRFLTDNLQRQIPAVVLQVKNRSNDVVSINSRCNKVRRKDYNSITARTKPWLKMNMQKLRDLIGWKRVHSHVTRVQSCSTRANFKERAHAFKMSSVLTFLRACAILLSLKNLLVRIYTKLHSKSCYYQY